MRSSIRLDRPPSRLARIAELREGVGREEFLLHYQAVVDLTGRDHGYEALVRWQHPTLGELPPGSSSHSRKNAGRSSAWAMGAQ